MPKVEVARVHETEIQPYQVAEAHTDALCLTSNGLTEYSVSAEGRSDITLGKRTRNHGLCSNGSDLAYALNVPVDDSSSPDFGNQLTLMVSAE
jgi:hypothetical protein